VSVVTVALAKLPSDAENETGIPLAGKLLAGFRTSACRMVEPAVVELITTVLGLALSARMGTASGFSKGFAGAPPIPP